MPGLPPQFDGYTILQISDLHGQRFGARQEELANAINALDYDLIAVTGDMKKHQTNDMQPFYDLLHAVHRKNPLLCVAGNAGPSDVNKYTGTITEAGKELQAEGCRLMDYPFLVERNGEHLWFAELYDDNRRDPWRIQTGQPMQTTDTSARQKYSADHAKYQKEIDDIFAGISPTDTLIGITHYPVTQDVLDDPVHDGMLPFDLVLAGHYHGGQFRVPMVGAIYVPIPSEPLKSLFPDQRIVSGLYIGNGMQQYVSRGLGAGGPIPLLRFRLFNSPEINLLTLHGTAK